MNVSENIKQDRDLNGITPLLLIFIYILLPSSMDQINKTNYQEYPRFITELATLKINVTKAVIIGKLVQSDLNYWKECKGYKG